MSKVRSRGEAIRRFIVQNVHSHPADISKLASAQFRISRQAVSKHLQKLVAEGVLKQVGQTRSRTYKLSPLSETTKTFQISPELAEDLVWRNDILPALGPLPENVLEIWHYGFTEMFNNAIDHSEGNEIIASIKKTAINTEMLLTDNGVGIFKKIQSRLNLLDERHAILELSKGKLTTDPKNHTGEGIFFTSRMFDSFDILSGGVFFLHKFEEPADVIIEREGFHGGTAVWMKLSNHTARTTRKVFDKFSSGNNYGFNKTIVPVRLARYGDDQLISRSQAKRLLTRIDSFSTVIFDFSEVNSVGQAFADEIFRVFAQKHPEIELVAAHANSQIKRMIERAKAGRPESS